MTSGIVNYFNKEDKYILFIYFYLFVMPWNFFKWQMGVLTAILFIWWLVKFRNHLFEKVKTIFDFRPLLILIVFIIYTYLTSFWSDSFEEGFDYVNNLHKYYFLLIPILFTSLNSEQAKVGIKLFILSFISYSIFSILIYLGLFVIEETNSNSSNPKGIMGYAIVTQYMAVGTISSFFLAIFSTSIRMKLVFFIFSFLCFFALVINNSRTAQLAFLLSIIVLFFFYYKNSFFKIKYILIFLISLVIIVLVSISLLEKENKLNRYKSLYNQAIDAVNEDKFHGSFGLRLYFNKVGLEILEKNLIFGMGPVDNNKYLKNAMKKDPYFKNKKIFSAFHNNHMDILTQYGLLGYLLLCLSVIYLFYKYEEKDNFYYVGLSFYTVIFFISMANATFSKKPINYIFISIFVLLSIIAYNKILENKKNN
jgi:O-antigen ligase